VEIAGADALDTACTIPAKDGMTIHTDTPGIRQLQRQVLQLLLTEHPDRCLNCVRLERCPPFLTCQRDIIVTDRCVICPQNRNCELQRVVDFLGRPQQWVIGPRTSREPEHSNPYIERNQDYCIYCTRCVRICDEVMGIAALGVAQPSSDPHIVVDFDTDLKDTNCILCGSCAIGCPVGAIVKVDRKYSPQPDSQVKSVCSFCGVGCGLSIETEHGGFARVAPDTESEASGGVLCIRGHFWHDYINSQDRLDSPLARNDAGHQVKVTWDEALDSITTQLVAIRQKFGPDSIGFVSAGKTTNEEAYLLQKIARRVIRTNNLDQPASAVSPAAAVLFDRFGYSASTASFDDLEQAGCLLAVNIDPHVSHPILAKHIWQAVRKGASLVVISERDTNLSQYARLMLRPNKDTTAVLLNGILREIFESGLEASDYITEHTEGVYHLKSSLSQYSLSMVTDVTGVPSNDIQSAAILIATGGCTETNERDLLWQGSTIVEPRQQPATDGACILLTGDRPTAQVALNIALVTGNIGRTGGGVLLPVSDSNSQGTSEMGVNPNWLPGYIALDKENSHTQPGLGFSQIIEAAKRREVRAMVVLGGASLAPDLGDFRPASKPLQELIARSQEPSAMESALAEIASQLDLLVILDIKPGTLASKAGYVLAGAALAEKDGTITNMERRVQAIHRAVEPPGQARPDWEILCELGRRLEAAIDGGNGFDFANPAEIMVEIESVAPIYQSTNKANILPKSQRWSAGANSAAGLKGGKVRLVPMD
jgi:formate dehydrogenase alpha subunit